MSFDEIESAVYLLQQGENETAWPQPAQHILAGNFGAVLAAGLPGLPGSFADLAWHKSLSTALPAYLSADASHVQNVFFFGVAANQLFLQLNATGPNLALGGEQAPAPQGGDWAAWAEDVLNSDGEVLQPTIVCPGYLALARLTLVDALASFAPSMQTIPLWAARVLVLQQRSLEANAASNYARLTALLATIAANAALLAGPLGPTVHLECATAFLLHNQTAACKREIDLAAAATGLVYTMEGAMGFRTRFQQDAHAQLFVSATPAPATSPSAAASAASGRLPPMAALTDDTLLADGIRFTEAQSHAALSPTDQAILVDAALVMQKSRAADDFMPEELMAFATRVLAHPTHWAPTLSGLIMRSNVEKKKTRRTPRALQQLELLVAAFDEKEPAVVPRQQGFYTMLVPLQSELELNLAELQLFLSLPRDAIPLFEKLQSWENLIHCYRLTEQHHRAEALVRERLAVKPSASLWCSLGDVTEDHTHYLTAWELSGHRSARAQRSLGIWNLNKAERASALSLPAKEYYQAAITAFELSLGLNTFQDGLWFSLGCAALRVDDFPTATHAFRRKTELDPENFEAWSNLASAHVRLKNYDKAYSALREAVKGGHEMWRVWANFCVVSVDVGAFRDVIRSVTRLVELGQSFDDPVILSILGKAIAGGLPDNNGASAALLAPKMDELLQLLKTSTKLTAPSWLVLAEYHREMGQADAALAATRTAFQEAKAVPQWERTNERAELVTRALEGLVAAALASQDAKAIRPTRLIIKPTLAALAKCIEQECAAPKAAEFVDRMQTLLTNVEASLST